MPSPSDDMRAGAAERATEGRKGQFKATLKREEETARRRAALAAQQSEARASRVADMRRIAMESLLNEGVNDVEEEVEVEDEDDDDGDAMDDTDAAERKAQGRRMRRLRRLHRTLFFARQLQVPDWMCAVPEDLASNWLLLVKPEGDRCLLLSDGGRVEVRRKNGYVLERFSDSRLPRGLTILDVVCMESEAPAAMETTSPAGAAPGDTAAAPSPEPAADQGGDAEDPGAVDVDMGGGGRGRSKGGRGGKGGKGGKGGAGKGGGKGGGKGRRGRPQGDRRYAVMDVLVWGDVDMVNAEAECRMFWLESRFAELSDAPSRRARPLQLISAAPATAEAFSRAYHDDLGYMKDSLLFLHRQGHYCIAEPVTPLALFWRDRHISRFVVDTADQRGEVLPERQAVVLELRGGGRLRCAEHHIVAQLPEEELAKAQGLLQGRAPKARALLRCEVEGVDAAGKQLRGVRAVAHVAARSRVWPDSWGRVVFQHLNRQGEVGHISQEVLLRAAGGALGA